MSWWQSAWLTTLKPWVQNCGLLNREEGTEFPIPTLSTLERKRERETERETERGRGWLDDFVGKLWVKKVSWV